MLDSYARRRARARVSFTTETLPRSPIEKFIDQMTCVSSMLNGAFRSDSGRGRLASKLSRRPPIEAPGPELGRSDLKAICLKVAARPRDAAPASRSVATLWQVVRGWSDLQANWRKGPINSSGPSRGGYPPRGTPTAALRQSEQKIKAATFATLAAQQ